MPIVRFIVRLHMRIDSDTDEMDVLFRRAFREHARAEPDYSKVWANIREQSRAYRQRTDQALLWSYTSFHARREWQLRCQWHTLEFTQFMSMSPVR